MGDKGDYGRELDKGDNEIVEDHLRFSACFRNFQKNFL